MEWELNRRWEKRRQEVVFLRQHTKKGLPGFVDFPVGLVNSVHFLRKCLENGKYCRRQTFGGTSDEDFIFRLVIMVGVCLRSKPENLFSFHPANVAGTIRGTKRKKRNKTMIIFFKR